jgi:hypothetical protein
MLRRLLRNAFFVTNRVNVIGELQEKTGNREQEVSMSRPGKDK